MINLYWCEECDTRLSDAELGRGKGVLLTGRAWCKRHKKLACEIPSDTQTLHALAPGASGSSQRSAASSRRAPAARGRDSARARARPEGNSSSASLLLGLGVAGVVIVGGVFALRGSGGSPRPPNRTAGNTSRTAPARKTSPAAVKTTQPPGTKMPPPAAPAPPPAPPPGPTAPAQPARPAGRPPSITLLKPVRKATVNEGGKLTLAVFATAGDARIVRVEYYAGEHKMGQASSAPYAFTWIVDRPGRHKLVAKVIDEAGHVVAADPVTLIVRSREEIAAARAKAKQAVSEGLIMHWPLDEGSGSVAKDASGNGHDGTLLRGTTWDADGRLGGAARFDGHDDCIENVAVAKALNGRKAITLAIWINAENVDMDNGFIGANRSANRKDDKVGVRLDKEGSDGKQRHVLKMAVNTTGGLEVYESARDTTAANEWRHYALVWAAGRPIRFYVNGKLDKPSARSGRSGGSIRGCNMFQVGRGMKNKGSFRGRADDVRVYGRALSAEEIRALYRFEAAAGTP